MKLPIQAQPVLRNGNTANIGSKTGIMPSKSWNCWLYFGTQGEFKGTVDSWWSDEPGAGVWACNNWISSCGNDLGGCEVTPA
jgi:hypothetical protein